MATAQYPNLVEVKLNTPGTPQNQGPPQFSVVPVEVGHNDESGVMLPMQRFKTLSGGQKFLRYYSVGRSTEMVICPLCREKSGTTDGDLNNCTDSVSSWLCCLSCCFPIFSICCIYTCCKAIFGTRRKFCVKCGGYLGFPSRPT